MTIAAPATRFFGWRVMWAAFVIAIFGWGVGFYGPPVFLHTLQTRGWPIGLVSAAVTAHFLLGALAVANMPRLYARIGLAATTKLCAVCTAVGIAGWAAAQAPWQLFIAAIFSGFGWAGSSALAINMMVSPWFNRLRPAALSTAYNGGSVGGVIFSPLWVALIAVAGFPATSVLIGAAMVAALWVLSDRYLSVRPGDIGALPDGDAAGSLQANGAATDAPLRPGRALWTSRAFVTYASGFAIGLFVQVGIIAHLISLLAPAVGTFAAGLAAGLATSCAIAGRMGVGWLLPAGADRRLAAAATYAVQACGCLAFILAGGQSVPLLLLGVVLFGVGIGNVTSLPPLIVQVEFAPADVPRAVALGTAIAQGAFAFAPVIFGLIREWAAAGGPVGTSHALVFMVAAAIQMVAAIAYLLGRSTGRRVP